MEIRERFAHLLINPYPCLRCERGGIWLYRSRMDRREVPPRSLTLAYWRFIDGLTDAEFADLLVARHRETEPDEGDLYHLEIALRTAATSH